MNLFLMELIKFLFFNLPRRYGAGISRKLVDIRACHHILKLEIEEEKHLGSILCCVPKETHANVWTFDLT